MKNKLQQAYSEILDAVNKHKDICVFDVSDMERKAKIHLFGDQLKNEYGLDINPKQVDSIDWNRFDDYRCVGMWGEKYRRKISWSIDGRQPEDEVLLQINFSTGAFIFGDGDIFNKDYPVSFFEKFWAELKSFNPDYVDEMNHGLYWKIENAKDIFNAFPEILEKYNKLNQDDIKLRRIEKMKIEIAKLESKL